MQACGLLRRFSCMPLCACQTPAYVLRASELSMATFTGLLRLCLKPDFTRTETTFAQEVVRLQKEVALDGAAALERQGFLDAALDLLGAARAGVGPARFAEAQLRIRLAQAGTLEPCFAWLCAHPSSSTGVGTGLCGRQTVRAHARRKVLFLYIYAWYTSMHCLVE